MRSSELSLEITQFYPDTLMNLECLILFKYKTASKLIQFENFFEQKPPKFEFVHKENNQNAYIDYKIYGGGDRKVFLGGGSVKLIHSLFNHSSIKLIDILAFLLMTEESSYFHLITQVLIRITLISEWKLQLKIIYIKKRLNLFSEMLIL